jgi:alpha-ketoglutarate-dependent taurine dioxygenase
MSNETTVAKNPKSSWATRRSDLKPKAIVTSQEDWVEMKPLFEGGSLPLLIQPKLKDVDLFDWAKNNRELIENRLLHHGGLLFRGFGLEGEEDFHRFLAALDAPLMHYTEGSTPRSMVSGKIYTSTEFPADQSIAPHNELNYVKTWPMKIWFFCATPPPQGGQTPIVDVRKVFDGLSPETRQRFVEKGWMLTRNFGDGFGLTWQTSYRVDNKADLEAYFREADIRFEWLDENHLRTRQVRPTVARHIKTGEMVWFNHVAFWHVSSLEPGIREMLLREFGEEGLPYNTYYGDGTRIEDSVAEELREAYRREMVAFSWQKGDLLMLDNVLVAHGRNPYTGPRKILTAMAEPCSNRNL